MASDNLVFLAVMFSCFICSEVLGQRMLNLKCQPAVGGVGQNMKISCSFVISSGDQGVTIDHVSISKIGQNNPVFLFSDKTGTGDPRFKLPSVNNPSLELSNTAVTDEGKYTYMLVTNRGLIEDGEFWISVTAKYSKPVTSSLPEVINDGGAADLYCKASGGYPAGAIHWFDTTGTNWTKSATLEIKKGEDNLLQMSSKLSFSGIQSSWAPFKCVVFNNKFVKEEEIDFEPVMKEGPSGASKDDSNNTMPNATIVAPLVVIGSLLVGLLLVIILRGRRNNRHCSNQTYAPADDPDVEKGPDTEKELLKGEHVDLKTQKPED